MRHLDLFSGIGGFALACRMVGGIETLGFVEIDPYCQAVLRKNFGAGPAIYDDIKTFRGDEYGAVDLITGGFPCQPYSFAGQQRGSADDRALWPEMLRVIKNAGPAWVVGENVAGIIRMELDRVLSDLEGAGYTVRTFAIPALAVDAKHQRNRVWIVANAKTEHWPKHGRKAHESGWGSEDLANSLREQNQRDQLHRIQHGATGSGETLPNANGRRCQEFNNFQSQSRAGRHNRPISKGWCEWPTEPELGRVAHGIPCRVDRLRGLGNAIVPQVAAQIIKAIKEIES